ncbi:hypothetical protein BGX28_004923 [Mortierella sp. GBA30]|nr:hypothetical protein BGX28_004923 [Mortierella sp. GBA30]
MGGITCNSCGTVPIRGLRYKCANCQDYDLCEGCEAAEVHNRSHVFMKIRIPIPPLANSRTKKLPPFYPGAPKGNTTIPEHVLKELLQKTHFDNVELEAMYNQYLSLSTLDQEGGGITRLTFEQALGPLGLEKNLITDRIFRFFDQDEDGMINFKEMACGLSVLCKGNFDEKIDFCFQGYDLDGDGYISREELHEMFKAYFYLSMELIRDVVKTMENDLISNFEFQPGMPLSSTFTAPIPRELGVRSSNHSSSNLNFTTEESSRNRESQSSTPPADWPLPEILTDNSSNTSAFNSSTTSPSEASQVVAEASSIDDGANYEPDSQQQQQRAVGDETLPTGSYGLVGSDLFADNVDDDKDEDDNVNFETPEAHEVEVLTLRTGANLEPSSAADDAGIDGNGWCADDDTSGPLSPPPLELISSFSSHEPWPSSTATTAARQITENTSVSNSGVLTPVPQYRTESSSQDNASSSSSRPRKDQPLPPITGSPHLVMPSISNTNLAWDRPHLLANPSTSFYHRPSAPTAPGAATAATTGRRPSLAPALAIGFGTTQPSSSPSSSSPYQPNEPLLESRSTDVIGGRRHSAGTPYQSYASSSYANATYFSSTFPIMESISQDAIQEMVEKTFSTIKNPSKPGYITLEEFRAYVLTDAGILGWFDALGSIF